MRGQIIVQNNDVKRSISFYSTWIIVLLIPVAITLALLGWRYFDVSCRIWWFGDYVGIISLGVGSIGLGITILTFFKAGIIENEVLRVKREHLYAQRIPDHIQAISETRDKFNVNRMKLHRKCSQQTKKQIFDELGEAAMRCGSSCESLLKKAPEQLHESIKNLHDKLISFQNLTMDDLVYGKEVNDLYGMLGRIWYNIVEFQEDRKARIQ